MRYIRRDYISKLSEEYKLILKKESHHNHEIIEDEQGVLRWEKNPDVRDLIDNKISLNDLIPLLHNLGYDKNSEIYRKLYRDMGYSLSGYWEIFYWEVNNPDAKLYKSKTINILKKLGL